MYTITYKNGDYDRDPKSGEYVYKDLIEEYKDKDFGSALAEFMANVGDPYGEKVSLIWVPKKIKGKQEK